MKVTTTWLERVSGLQATAEYEDADDFSHLPYTECTQVSCVTFQKRKLLIVYSEKTDSWGLPGGSIEENETFEECAIRELKEEANVRPLTFIPIGFQKAWLVNKPIEYQLRIYCEIERIGEFVGDPDGDITEIKYINSEDYKKYFDWGKVSDRLIERGLEVYDE